MKREANTKYIPHMFCTEYVKALLVIIECKTEFKIISYIQSWIEAK